MSIDYSDEVGWPATVTPAWREPRRQAACWDSFFWRERMNHKRRERYRQARMAGVSSAEAKAASSRAA